MTNGKRPEAPYLEGDEARLWDDIDAASPRDELALSGPAPSGAELDEWLDRARTQSDRRRTFIGAYAWAVPSRAAIAAIAAFVGPRRLLEVCAGGGLWARLLSAAGVSVVATDAHPEALDQYFPVEEAEAAAAVRAHPDCSALLLCWPPFRSDCAFRAAGAFAGDRLVFVGDTRFTADQQFRDLLKAEWTLNERVVIPAWPGLDDYTFLYERTA